VKVIRKVKNLRKVKKAQDQKVRLVLECREKVILKVKDRKERLGRKVKTDRKVSLDRKVNKGLLPGTSIQATERWGPETLLVREVMALVVVETFSQVEMI
jgi:nucleoid DNA-binding protein